MIINPFPNQITTHRAVLAGSKHHTRQFALMTEQIINRGCTGQFLPMGFGFDGLGCCAQQAKLEACADGKIGCPDIDDITPGCLGNADDIANGDHLLHRRHTARQIFGHTPVDQGLRFLIQGRAEGRIGRNDIVKRLDHLGNRRTEQRDLCPDIQFLAIAQEPQGHIFDHAIDVGEHRDLDLGIDLVVEGLDTRPQFSQAEHRTGNQITARNIHRRKPGCFHHVMHEGPANAVDQTVGPHGCDDFAFQTMVGNRRAVFFTNCRREIPHQFLDKDRIIGQIGFKHLVIQPQLGIGHQNRDFRTGKALMGRRATCQFLVIGKIFDFPVQTTFAFEHPDQANLRIKRIPAPGKGVRDRLALQIVVTQHQIADLVGHFDQQFVTLLFGHVAGSYHLAHEDLDIDLVIRAVHTRRIVDGVRIQPSASMGILDTTALCAAKVGTFADDLCADILAIDANGIVGAVPGIGIRFRR